MNWPNWMEDYVWQWLTVVAIGIISIIVTIVLALRSKCSSQRPNINGDDNIQVTNSPKAKVTINKINLDEYTRNEKHSSKKTIFKLFNQVLKHNETYNIVFGGDFETTKFIFFEFPLSVVNMGERSIENSYFIFNFAQNSPLPLDDETGKLISPLPKKSAQRKVESDHTGKHLTLSLTHLNPKIEYQIREMFLIPETDMKLKVPATTADDIDIIATVELSIQHTLKLIFTAQDSSPQIFYFNLEALNAKNIGELQKIKTKSLYDEIKRNPKSKILNRNLFLTYPEFKLYERIEMGENYKYYIGYLSENKKDVFILDSIAT